VSQSVGASISFLVWGEGEGEGGLFQIVFGMKSGLFIVHFPFGQFELSLI